MEDQDKLRGSIMQLLLILDQSLLGYKILMMSEVSRRTSNEGVGRTNSQAEITASLMISWCVGLTTESRILMLNKSSDRTE